ncbi:histone H1 [Mucilaginibacter corticis]|uniref:Histone H1 n=1 Tax=Mucilaginibacter corticis TaxID=2597670 RepID=A0A556MMM4_9SPHI|nr:histone H1 [Mucilaginibacter corticis]TSJ41058.1 histone H1 [Mucilaginibacter corticis]
MEKFEKVKAIIASLETDVLKFYEKGNAAAGTRVRIGMQRLKSAAFELRRDITEKKKEG